MGAEAVNFREGPVPAVTSSSAWSVLPAAELPDRPDGLSQAETITLIAALKSVPDLRKPLVAVTPCRRSRCLCADRGSGRCAVLRRTSPVGPRRPAPGSVVLTAAVAVDLPAAAVHRQRRRGGGGAVGVGARPSPGCGPRGRHTRGWV